jgi:transcriptional regulator with XRE-family HTH domain
MPNIDENAKKWQMDMTERVGQAVRTARQQAGLSAAQLAERTREVGFPIHRVAITKIETNSRAGKLDVAELIILAMALHTPPVQLLFPNLPDGEAELRPGLTSTNIKALEWFSGEDPLTMARPSTSGDTRRLQLSRELSYLRLFAVAQQYRLPPDATEEQRQEAERAIHDTTERLRALREEARANGWPVNDD